jgi:iron complex outermembrane receptor protein
MRYLERNRRSLGRNSSFGAAMTALALVHSAPALAQEESTVAQATEADPGDQIIVTGSRVARDGFQAPTPLTVLTETEIESSSPSNNIADFVNTLPSLAGSTP